MDLQKKDPTETGGYFMVHRCILDSPVFADESLLRLWLYLLCRAAFKTQHVQMTTGRGKSVVTLHPGQLITGRKKTSDDLGWPPSTFRDRMVRLEELGMISQRHDSNWTVVSITNWLVYQNISITETTTNRQPTDNQTTGFRQANDNQPTHSKNSKNSKNDKNAEKSRPRFDPPSVEQVRAYCEERKNYVDPEQFVDHYTANGWKQAGGQPIRDWKAAVRTWERNGKSNQANQQPKTKTAKEVATL